MQKTMKINGEKKRKEQKIEKGRKTEQHRRKWRKKKKMGHAQQFYTSSKIRPASLT